MVGWSGCGSLIAEVLGLPAVSTEVLGYRVWNKYRVVPYCIELTKLWLYCQE